LNAVIVSVGHIEIALAIQSKACGPIKLAGALATLPPPAYHFTIFGENHKPLPGWFGGINQPIVSQNQMGAIDVL